MSTQPHRATPCFICGGRASPQPVSVDHADMSAWPAGAPRFRVGGGGVSAGGDGAVRPGLAVSQETALRVVGARQVKSATGWDDALEEVAGAAWLRSSGQGGDYRLDAGVTLAPKVGQGFTTKSASRF